MFINCQKEKEYELITVLNMDIPIYYDPMLAKLITYGETRGSNRNHDQCYR
jgi:acetyl/propionyl-CoA carboxylase alpha subunit